MIYNECITYVRCVAQCIYFHYKCTYSPVLVVLPIVIAITLHILAPPSTQMSYIQVTVMECVVLPLLGVSNVAITSATDADAGNVTDRRNTGDAANRDTGNSEYTYVLLSTVL